MNTTQTLTTRDLGNNESISTGYVKNANGTFTALTYAQSKTFKTERGAIAWLARRSYNADGTRMD
jgi:glutamine cyclotransferase